MTAFANEVTRLESTFHGLILRLQIGVLPPEGMLDKNTDRNGQHTTHFAMRL
jgi:hypothetical protein